MNPVESETLLLEYFASVLALERGKHIFRGRLPDGLCDALRIGIEDAGGGNAPHMDTFSVQALGRYENRDAALTLCGRLENAAPYWSPSLILLKRGTASVYPTVHNGRNVWGISANFEACIRLSIRS